MTCRVTVTQLRAYADSFMRATGRAALLPNPPVSTLEHISHRERTHGDSVARGRYNYVGKSDQGRWILLGYEAFRYDEQHDDVHVNPFELKSACMSGDICLTTDSIYHVSRRSFVLCSNSLCSYQKLDAPLVPQQRKRKQTTDIDQVQYHSDILLDINDILLTQYIVMLLAATR